MNMMIQNNSTAVSSTTNPTFTLDVPTIASSAVLIKLTIGKWSDQVQDKVVSDQVNASYGASDGATKMIKSLLGGDCAELKDVQRVESAARRANKKLTLPWDNSQDRLLAGELIAEHTCTMTEWMAKHEDAVDRLIERFNDLCVDAQLSLGSVYNADEYPSVDEIKERFYFRLAHKPIPQSGHFISDLWTTSLEVAAQSCERDNEANITNMIQGLFKPVYEMLGNMSERLDYEDTGEVEEYYTKPTASNPEGMARTRKVGVKTFNATLVSNVLEVAAQLERYNLANDPAITSATLKIKETLHEVTAEALRDDDSLRKDTKRNIDAVIASLPSLDM